MPRLYSLPQPQNLARAAHFNFLLPRTLNFLIIKNPYDNGLFWSLAGLLAVIQVTGCDGKGSALFRREGDEGPAAGVSSAFHACAERNAAGLDGVNRAAGFWLESAGTVTYQTVHSRQIRA